MSSANKFPGQLRFAVIGKDVANLRHDLTANIRGRGGLIQQRVSSETDIVFVLGASTSADVRRAFDLRAKGHPIQFNKDVDVQLFYDDPVAFFNSLPEAIRQRRLQPQFKSIKDTRSMPMPSKNPDKDSPVSEPLQLQLHPCNTLPTPRRKPMFEMSL